MGFISKLILPGQVDFDRALQQQAHQASRMIQELWDDHVAADTAALGAMKSDAEEIRSLKNRNMRENGNGMSLTARICIPDSLLS